MIKHEINAENMSMGRVASQATHYLRGKHLPSFNPRILPQVEVTISNIDKIYWTKICQESILSLFRLSWWTKNT